MLCIFLSAFVFFTCTCNVSLWIRGNRQTYSSAVAPCRRVHFPRRLCIYWFMYAWYTSQTTHCYYTEIYRQLSRAGLHWYLSYLAFFQDNPETQKICLGESTLIEEDYKKKKDLKDWAGGGGGGGGATYIFRVSTSSLHPAWAMSSRATSFHCQSWHIIVNSLKRVVKKEYPSPSPLFCLSLYFIFLIKSFISFYIFDHTCHCH